MGTSESKCEPAKVRKPTNTQQFYDACEKGDLQMVERLLKTLSEAEVKKIMPGKNNTALHAAVAAGRINVVRFLLNRKVDFNVTDEQGKTPLDIATNDDIKQLLKNAKQN